MHTAHQDVRYALRQLRKAPGFACTVILILGLGIGGTSAIFGALNSILFEPLPYPHADRIVMIWYAGESGQRDAQAFHTYREVAERSRSFESLAVMKPWQPTLLGNDVPERIEGQRVSADYFRVLGTSPSLGRSFLPVDDNSYGPAVVVLSNGLWQRRFGSDRSIVGKHVKLDGADYLVIGVMPHGFENVLSPSAEVWAPLQYESVNPASTETREWGHHLRMIGRLRAHAALKSARQDLQWIAKTPLSEFPRARWASLDHGFILASLQDDVTRSVRPGLIAIFLAAILLLLIACVNVTNLVLGRSTQRQGEFTMRAALGAAPARLGRQLVTESLILALLGGGLAILFAQVGIKILAALSPADLPRVNAIRFDTFVFFFVFAITMLVGLAVGILPARQASRTDLLAGLQQQSHRSIGSHQVVRNFFVVSEIALALVLLVSTGLLLRSLVHLISVPAGFDASHVLTMQVQTYGSRYEDDRARSRFFAQAVDSVRHIPGVAAAGFTSQLPLSGDSDIYGAHFQGDEAAASYPVYRYAVTPGYFPAMRIPLLRGRLLDERDTADHPHVIVISQSLANRRFQNQDPMGRRVHVGGPANSPLFTIVGVVGDVRQMSLALSDTDAVYTTTTQWHWADATLSLAVRAQGDAASLSSVIKNAIWSVDKEQPIVRAVTMPDLVARSTAERRFFLILFEAFGLVALLLAATGIYGVLSANVSERTREIGVRSALGASRGNIVRLIARHAMILTGAGILLGGAGAGLASQAIAAMLFGVAPFDMVTYVGVTAILAAASAIACSVPALRAVRLDPMLALRYE